ncbi:MAG: BON domain-containing protein [Bacteroidales bacterium]
MTRRPSPVALLLATVLLLPIVAAGCGKTVGDTIDDATITTRVKTALLNEPALVATGIDVETTAAVVTLSGSVKSTDDEQRAVRVARQVPGVKDVKSTLKVQ